MRHRRSALDRIRRQNEAKVQSVVPQRKQEVSRDIVAQCVATHADRSTRQLRGSSVKGSHLEIFERRRSSGPTVADRRAQARATPGARILTSWRTRHAIPAVLGGPCDIAGLRWGTPQQHEAIGIDLISESPDAVIPADCGEVANAGISLSILCSNRVPCRCGIETRIAESLCCAANDHVPRCRERREGAIRRQTRALRLRRFERLPPPTRNEREGGEGGICCDPRPIGPAVDRHSANRDRSRAGIARRKVSSASPVPVRQDQLRNGMGDREALPCARLKKSVLHVSTRGTWEATWRKLLNVRVAGRPLPTRTVGHGAPSAGSSYQMRSGLACRRSAYGRQRPQQMASPLLNRFHRDRQSCLGTATRIASAWCW